MVGSSLEIEAGLGIEVGEDRFPLAYSHAVLGPDHPTVLAGPKTPRLPPATQLGSASDRRGATHLGAEVCGRGQHKYAAPCAGSRFTRLARSLRPPRVGVL